MLLLEVMSVPFFMGLSLQWMNIDSWTGTTFGKIAASVVVVLYLLFLFAVFPICVHRLAFETVTKPWFASWLDKHEAQGDEE